MKFALGIEYNGNSYHGWQFQKSVKTVQGELERVLSYIANHKIKIICAGRTDSGVHATSQVIHFETHVIRTEFTWTIGVNSYLPNDIAVLWIKRVSGDFHARYSALSRTYRYIIYNKSIRSAILDNKLLNFHKGLDIDKMNEAGQYLIGEHDFSAFRGKTCQSYTPWRKIISLQVIRKDNFVIIEVTANAFLYRMVRNIVGCLLDIGVLKKKVNWISTVLNLKNRHLTGSTAPAKGLYLVSVDYPNDFDLPRSPKGPLLF
ncbi:tRNA pseudouridine(38-40) synthase TruA [Buchnera aphidicola]|uniref:tRNA pseudouridine(38-40) synthase TruA n=1 Tax=Buchnera aphidicola TaxID=9 RepID=UPI0034640135